MATSPENSQRPGPAGRRREEAGDRGGQAGRRRDRPPGDRRQAGNDRPTRDDGGARARSIDGPRAADGARSTEGVRLQKVLASAGLGSRRACEELITAGRVSVDGDVVRELGARVDPLTAVIHVDGLRVQLDPTLVTVALNKPLGVVSTMHDPRGRPSLASYVADRPERLFHIGRLDADTSGLLLLTNDGELGHRLMHPSYEVPKTYVATVQGRVDRGLGRRLLAGVELEDGPVRVGRFTVKDTTPNSSIVEVVLHEGRNHVVRRLLAEVGHPVTALTRTQIGSVRLGHLRPGATRVVDGQELGALMAAVGL